MKDTQLLIIGYVWPEPNSSAAGRRMMQLISLFRSEGWEITFASSAAESEYMADLESLDINSVSIEVNSSSFDSFVEKLNPSVVIFDRFVVEEQFGWRVAEVCPGAIRMLDTEDLHCLRKVRRKAVEEGKNFEKKDLLSEDIAKREVASILRCDLSLIISEAELSLLTNIFGVKQNLLLYLPFLLTSIDKSVKNHWPSFKSRNHFITVGNFRHAPNRDAVHYLKEEIWPLVRRDLSGAQMHVYGAYPTQNIQNLDQPDDGFFIKGRAQDARSVVRSARVCLAPLRFGAGLKGKLVESMQCGTPSVTTDIGAEGIAGDHEWSGIIADTTEDIASAAVELYSNQSLWENAQAKGIRIINNRFSHDLFETKLVKRISNIRSNLEEHRLQNFTGSMLMHHTTAGTKYMSKWIEAKNK